MSLAPARAGPWAAAGQRQQIQSLADTRRGIHRGRQLFVDDFLIDTSRSNMSRTFHSGTYVSTDRGQVLKADREWEGLSGINRQAMPFSGGAFFDRNVTKLWYTCGAVEAGWPCRGQKGCSVNTCLALSSDGGLSFSKPDLRSAQAGTNIVRKVSEGYDVSPPPHPPPPHPAMSR